MTGWIRNTLLVCLVLNYCTSEVTGQEVTLPYTENFDGGTAGSPGILPDNNWQQVVEGTTATCTHNNVQCYQWGVWSGGTTSSNTGPSSDHTTGSGNYIYVEASQNTNPIVELLSPSFDLAGDNAATFTFWSHSYNGSNNNIHTLNIDIVDDGNTTTLGNDLVSITDTNVNGWQQYSVSLSAYANSGIIRVKFQWVGGNASWQLDHAIDDIEISSDFCAANRTYADDFSAAAYNNSNGNISWTSNSWIEYNDEGAGPTTGEIQITGGELRMNSTGTPSPYIERALDLTSAIQAEWNFTYRESGFLENSDRFFAEVFNGSTWTTLLTEINDFGSGSASFDITPYANANTRIRYRINSYSGTSEFLYVDDVQICYEIGAAFTTDFYLEAECEYVGDGWFTAEDGSASNENYVEPKAGENFNSSAPADTNYFLTFTLDIDSTGLYEVFGRIIAPNGGDDSFWVRANGGTWYSWNGLSTNTSWTWLQVWDSDNGDANVSFSLSSGINTIDFAVREDGTQLDKLFVTLDGSIPSGEGGAASNCYSLFGTDSDQDGIVDGIDLDDDNDGILDSRENPSNIDFSGSRTLLVGSNQNDLLVNDKVMYDDAIRDCNDIVYDAVITINTISSGVTVAANSNGIDITGALASQDDHTTFTLSVVENGSASIGNPAGTPATITDLTIDMQDVDSDDGDDYTEVVGFNNALGATSSYLNDPTSLEPGDFINGFGPSGSWTTYRQEATSGVDDWTDNDNISSAIFSPEIAMYMVFTDFSEVQLVFGLTGSLATAPSIATRATRFGASAECDRDGDGIPNRLDLDLDNDGIYDLHEAGHPYTVDADNDGRIDGADTLSGTNGIFDSIETTAESGILNYTYAQSDLDNIEDAFDRDSDGDGCFDTEEADTRDPDTDGVAGSGTATADANGLVISIIYKPPPTTAWQDSLASCLEICDNGLDDDGDGDIDEDDADCADYYLEAECGFPGDLWTRGFDALASNDDYLTISPGNNATSTPPVSADGLIRFTATIDVAGTYRFLGRVYSSTGADDSFWFRVDDGTWYRWNDWNTADTWKWIEFTDHANGNTIVKYILTAGVHTIDIAYSEDGARIDKLHLTINGTTPTGEGEDAINCGRTVTYNLFLPYKVLNKN